MQTVSLRTMELIMRLRAMIARATLVSAGGNMKAIAKLALVFVALAFISSAFAGDRQHAGQNSLWATWARLAKPVLKNATPVGTLNIRNVDDRNVDDEDEDDCSCCCRSGAAYRCTGGTQECREDYNGSCVAKSNCGR
jgi:hypothetical protein